MRESKIEKLLTEQIQSIGGNTRKWISPQHNGVPDQILFHPRRVPFFIEVKKKGEFPSPHQWREIMRLIKLNCEAGYLAGSKEVELFMMNYIASENHAKIWLRNHVLSHIPGKYIKK